MNTPWRVSETDHSRVCILGADGRVMTEIIPGQVHGKPVTQIERVTIAQNIVSAVNKYQGVWFGVGMLPGAKHG